MPSYWKKKKLYTYDEYVFTAILQRSLDAFDSNFVMSHLKWKHDIESLG